MLNGQASEHAESDAGRKDQAEAERAIAFRGQLRNRGRDRDAPGASGKARYEGEHDQRGRERDDGAHRGDARDGGEGREQRGPHAEAANRGRGQEASRETTGRHDAGDQAEKVFVEAELQQIKVVQGKRK